MISASFFCNVCDKMFNRWSSLRRHREIEKHHILSYRSKVLSLAKGYSYMSKCCAKLLLCDKDIIKAHMKKCFKKNTNGEMRNVKKQYNEFCKSFIDKIPVSTKKYCKMTVPVRKIPTMELTSTIGNLCTFVCSHCSSQKFFSSYSQLQDHTKNVHLKGNSFDSSLLVTARYHAWLKCPRAVLSDRYILSIHLQKYHNRSLHNYEQVFRKNGGTILPTYEKYFESVM